MAARPAIPFYDQISTPHIGETVACVPEVFGFAVGAVQYRLVLVGVHGDRGHVSTPIVKLERHHGADALGNTVWIDETNEDEMHLLVALLMTMRDKVNNAERALVGLQRSLSEAGHLNAGLADL